MYHLPPCDTPHACAAQPTGGLAAATCLHGGVPLRDFVVAQPLGTVLWMMRKAGNLVPNALINALLDIDRK